MAYRPAICWLAAFSAVLVPANCYAYIDPNAGGWLLQLLFPLLVAIGAGWIALRRKIGALWNRLFKRPNSHEDNH